MMALRSSFSAAGAHDPLAGVEIGQYLSRGVVLFDSHESDNRLSDSYEDSVSLG
jgi:hypothetical protein